MTMVSYCMYLLAIVFSIAWVPYLSTLLITTEEKPISKHAHLIYGHKMWHCHIHTQQYWLNIAIRYVSFSHVANAPQHRRGFSPELWGSDARQPWSIEEDRRPAQREVEVKVTNYICGSGASKPDQVKPLWGKNLIQEKSYRPMSID